MISIHSAINYYAILVYQYFYTMNVSSMA